MFLNKPLERRVIAAVFRSLVLMLMICLALNTSFAQVAPSASEIAQYAPLHAATWQNDVKAVQTELASGVDPNLRDTHQRSPVHIAAHAGAYETLEDLVAAGADIKAMDFQQYDAITIAAVNNDVRMLKLAISLGGDPNAITSPYQGTALIAAAHLGHVEEVKTLIAAGSPLDHINNLHWTALIEAVVLGDGGKGHTEIVRMLLAAGASADITDRNGVGPLGHAKDLGYQEMIELLR